MHPVARAPATTAFTELQLPQPSSARTSRRPRALCLPICIGILAWTCNYTTSLQAADSRERTPNIVLVFTDDQGYGDVGVFGARGYTTPNLDRLAAQGRLFRNFHVAQAVCSASRAALLTGCYPNRIGLHGALSPRSTIGLHERETTLAELLRGRGYATAAVGKWHLGDAPEFLPTRHGFDSYLGVPYSNDMWPLHPDLLALPAGHADRTNRYPPLPLLDGTHAALQAMTADDQENLIGRYTARAVEFIETHRDRPFFLYLAHNMPHVPLHASTRFRGTTAHGLYGDVIQEIDWSVGQVLDALARHRLERNTWVIFTSDNGPWLSYGNHAGSSGGLREGKGTSWEGGVRVPCIMRWPGHIPAGSVSDQFLCTIDLLPTIAARTGTGAPAETIDGLDVWKLLAGRRPGRNPHAAYWFYYAVNELQAVASGDGRWKLVLPHRYRTLADPAGGRDGKPVAYRMVGIDEPQLYDLRSDPGETIDVSSRHPDVVNQLQIEAEKARAELGDSLTQRTGSGVRAPGRIHAN